VVGRGREKEGSPLYKRLDLNILPIYLLITFSEARPGFKIHFSLFIQLVCIGTEDVVNGN
jgi:hypothetical protein